MHQYRTGTVPIVSGIEKTDKHELADSNNCGLYGGCFYLLPW